MNRSIRSTSRRGALALSWTAALLSLGTAAACAQEPTPQGGRAAAASQSMVAPDSVMARAERSRSRGADSAPVTLFEVSDFQCPYCRQFAETTYRQLDSAYIRTGKVRLVFINYPIPSHGQAWAASEAAMCAGAQGKFWEMHDRLFATQREWNGSPDAVSRFAGLAGDLKLDPAAFRACTEGDQTASIILSDVMQAAGAGIRGTPTFVVNGNKTISGAIPFADLSREIEAALAAPRPPSPPQ